MRILCYCVMLTCPAAAVCLPAAHAGDETATETVADVSELKVLDRLRGEWSGTLGGGDAKLTQTSRWILDGHVLETKFQLDGGFRGLLLRTYDADDSEYVATYMDATGSVVLMTGSWDENQQTLTTTGKNGGQKVTLSTRFVDGRTTQWTITQATGGAESSRITGTNHRIRH